jgi:hypothetical protein
MKRENATYERGNSFADHFEKEKKNDFFPSRDWFYFEMKRY